MKPISPLIVILWILVSGVVAFGYGTFAVNNGLEVPISGITLSISTALIAVILLGLSVPIWNYKRSITKALSTSKPLPVQFLLTAVL